MKTKELSKEHKRKISDSLKGRVPWNKGKKHSEETKRKISDSHKGHPYYKNPERGRKISEALCGIKRPYAKENGFKKGHSFNKDKRHTLQSRINMSLGKTGKSEFDGFKTPEHKKTRLSKKYINWRNHVFERDNYTCQNLNCKHCENKQGVYLHPHHIKHFSKYEELRFEIDNGITYCKEYHLKNGIHKKGD